MNDKTITIYNYYKANKIEEWQRTVIRGVEYSYKHDKTITADGKIVLTEVLTVVIPAEANTSGRIYIEYPQYLKLEDTSEHWTINPSCNKEVIVCGECTSEVTDDYLITELQKDHLKSGTVSGFSDNTEGDLLKHYKVVCK